MGNAPLDHLVPKPEVEFCPPTRRLRRRSEDDECHQPIHTSPLHHFTTHACSIDSAMAASGGSPVERQSAFHREARGAAASSHSAGICQTLQLSGVPPALETCSDSFTMCSRCANSAHAPLLSRPQLSSAGCSIGGQTVTVEDHLRLKTHLEHRWVTLWFLVWNKCA